MTTYKDIIENKFKSEYELFYEEQRKQIIKELTRIIKMDSYLKGKKL